MRLGKIERLDKLFLRHFVGLALDHDDLVFGADINEVQIAVLALASGWDSRQTGR